MSEPTSIMPETPVRLNVKQISALAVFFVINTAVVVLYMDRRQSSLEHRTTLVEREQATLSSALQSSNAKLERLTDAINALALNVARLGVK